MVTKSAAAIVGPGRMPKLPTGQRQVPNWPILDLGDSPEVTLDDWRLDSQNQIAGDFTAPQAARSEGRIGTHLIVNGAPAPAAHEARPGARIRLRLANLANARLMMLMVSSSEPKYHSSYSVPPKKNPEAVGSSDSAIVVEPLSL